MAFPSTDGNISQLAKVLEEVRILAGSIKRESQRINELSAVGDYSARGIATYLDDLQIRKNRIDVLKVTPGLSVYAQNQYDDVSFDIQTEFTTMQVAINTVITWIEANLPADSVSGRWVLLEEIVNGKLTQRMLSSAQTAGLRAELTTLIATID